MTMSSISSTPQSATTTTTTPHVLLTPSPARGVRVLFVWGSESNVTKNFVYDIIAKQWNNEHNDEHRQTPKKKNKDDDGDGDENNNNKDSIAVTTMVPPELKLELEIVMGDTMADRWEEITVENYDYLFVATSSYAEGDPPTGFGKFLYKLQETTKEFDGNDQDRKPLYGIQHAVLGVGSTQYETFMNIPRHIDRYLGMVGSRRCKQRLEWDEMHHTDEEIVQWSKDMYQIILMSKEKNSDGTANTTSTTTTVTNNNNDEDTHGSSSDGSPPTSQQQQQIKLEPDVCSWEEPHKDIFEKVVGEDGWEDVGRTQFELSPWMMIVGFIVIVLGARHNKFGQEEESNNFFVFVVQKIFQHALVLLRNFKTTNTISIMEDSMDMDMNDGAETPTTTSTMS